MAITSVTSQDILELTRLSEISCVPSLGGAILSSGLVTSELGAALSSLDNLDGVVSEAAVGNVSGSFFAVSAAFNRRSASSVDSEALPCDANTCS